MPRAEARRASKQFWTNRRFFRYGKHSLRAVQGHGGAAAGRAGVSNGYTGDHAEENRAFVTLPDGERMYRSGDLGYLLPDDNIAFLHRKDTQIMIYGKQVEVMEVESRLYQCSGVEQAVVRPFTDEEGLSYMIAYIVPRRADLKVSQVRKELAENLTSFMIPEFIVKMPQIPLNTNGKPDLTRLPVVMKEGKVYERIG